MNISKLITQLLPSRAPTCYQDAHFHQFNKVDIALALSHAPKLNYYLLSWYLLQDGSAWAPLVNCMCDEIHKLDLTKRQRKLIKPFTSTALLEWAGLNLCRHCNGSGIVKAVEVCQVCRGRGKLKFTQAQKEKMCNISSGHWRRDGDQFYKMILNEIDIIEKESLQFVSNQLTLDKLAKNDIQFFHAAKLSQKVA